ncbi:MAG: pitrilysin family protein [bacterium]|nr:pitrilysin family protein [bacterium]
MNQSATKSLRVLPNGLKLYCLAHPGIKTLTMHAWVFTGSAFESPEVNGVSHFLEHMLFRGNAQLGNSVEMSLAIERLGGEMNAATGFDHTEYWLECHRDYLDQALSNFAAFLCYPSFEQIDTERAIILEEIKSDFNEKEQLIDPDQLSAQAIWPGQAMGLPVSGTQASVSALEVPHLRGWYEQYYTANNMILGISGDFDPARAEEMFSHHLAQLPPGRRYQYQPPVSRILAETQFTWSVEPDNQYNLAWSFLHDHLTPRHRVLLQLISRMLDDGSSSRLQRIIREELGLVYDIHLSPSFYDGGAALVLQATVGKERLGELVDALVVLLNEVIQKGFGPEELHLSKLRLQTALDCFSDTAEGRLHEMVAPELYPAYLPLDSLTHLLAEIDLEEVNQMAAKVLSNKESAFVFVGPEPGPLKGKIQDKLAPWSL